MLKKCDLSRTIDDRTLAEKVMPLQQRIGELQRQLRDEKIPVIIVIEGWNASGITMTIQELRPAPRPQGIHPFFHRFTCRPGEDPPPHVAVLEPYSRGRQDCYLRPKLVPAGRLPRKPAARAGNGAWTGSSAPSIVSSAISPMTGRLLSRSSFTSAKRSRKRGSSNGRPTR